MRDYNKNSVNPSKVKSGDLMAFVNYVKVKNVNSSGDELIVVDLDHDNKDIRITGAALISNSFSGDQYETEEKVTKTEAAEILISAHNKPLTVSFQKADGSERLLRGRLIRPEPLLGRSMVEDLDATGDNRVRQVDHRTINFLVLDGVRFNVK